MAGFEYGENLICMGVVKVGSSTFKPGEDFPYSTLGVDPALVDLLLSQRKIARKAHLSAEAITELGKDRTEKIIRNFHDGRVAISWPSDEPLPDGVIDGRPGAEVSDVDEESEESETEESSVKDSEENTDGGSDENTSGIENSQTPSQGTSVQIVPAEGAGWYNVEVDGIVVNPKKLRKRDALVLKKEYM